MPPTLPASSPSSREARALLIRPCTLRCTIGWRRSEKLFPSCTMLLRHGAHLPAVGAVLRRRASAPAPVCARLHHRPSWHLCCVVPYVHWPWESGTVRVCGRDQCGPLSRSFRCVLDTSAVCFTARLLPDPRVPGFLITARQVASLARSRVHALSPPLPAVVFVTFTGGCLISDLRSVVLDERYRSLRKATCPATDRSLAHCRGGHRTLARTVMVRSRCSPVLVLLGPRC